MPTVRPPRTIVLLEERIVVYGASHLHVDHHCGGYRDKSYENEAHTIPPGDDLAPSNHSITSSARTRIDRGTSRPSALAVLRFTAISYFVGNCTGRSPGFSPRRMRST